MNIFKEKSVVQTYELLHKLPLGSITAAGWLKDQLQRSKEGTGGHLDELEPDMIANPFINYSAFKRLPGASADADPTFAAGWSSEISGVYWTGLVELAFTLNDPELIAKAERWVNGVLAHQEADGYLGGFPAHTDRMVDYNAWSCAWCYRALLSFYEATGRQEVLDAVYKGLLWFCDVWKNNKTDYVGAVIIEPMVIVYAMTGDKRLVKFCEDWLAWLEDHSMWQNKISQYQSDELPYTSMHVVAYGEDLKHPALVYCASGDRELLEASLNAARKALDKIVQTTGGPSSCNEYLSPKGAVHETEYCNFVTFSHTYSWLAMLTGKAAWGDEIERILFNGAQGARKKDERASAYMSSPNQLHANSRSSLYGSRVDMQIYAPCFCTACCPTQAVRIVPEFIRGMCLENNAGDLYWFTYGPVQLKTNALEMEMDTVYPFRENIRLQVKKADGRKLHLRIPAWCKKPCIRLNGGEIAVCVDENGFAPVAEVRSGDVLEITFPMDIKLVRVDDSDGASKYPISIERGPLVYALPVPEEWLPVPGSPVTPLPEGWTWYAVNPDLSFAGKEKEHPPTHPTHRHTAYCIAPWAKAIDERITPAQIQVEELPMEGYVWENPPIALHVPLYHAPESYITVGHKTQESFGVPLRTEGPEQLCKMVPHGCTNLRITYLPRGKVNES